MPFFHKAALIAGGAVFLLGLLLLLPGRPVAPDPPVLSEPSQSAAAPARDPFPSVDVLSAPWFRPAPPALPAAPTPAARPPAAPLRVDTASVVFLGSYKDLDGTPTYFFKFNPTGQMITLRLGETRRGWTLTAITDQKFTLSGSGGLYEVNR